MLKDFYFREFYVIEISFILGSHEDNMQAERQRGTQGTMSSSSPGVLESIFTMAVREHSYSYYSNADKTALTKSGQPVIQVPTTYTQQEIQAYISVEGKCFLRLIGLCF